MAAGTARVANEITSAMRSESMRAQRQHTLDNDSTGGERKDVGGVRGRRRGSTMRAQRYHPRVPLVFRHSPPRERCRSLRRATTRVTTMFTPPYAIYVVHIHVAVTRYATRSFVAQHNALLRPLPTAHIRGPLTPSKQGGGTPVQGGGLEP